MLVATEGECDRSVQSHTTSVGSFSRTGALTPIKSICLPEPRGAHGGLSSSFGGGLVVGLDRIRTHFRQNLAQNLFVVLASIGRLDRQAGQIMCSGW